jgi:hypothetical protein
MLSGAMHAEGLPVGRHLAADGTGHPTVAHMPALDMIDHGVLGPRGEGAVAAAEPPARTELQHLRLDNRVNLFKLPPFQF